tara:strand:- start:33 stop:758 length:726 start_codon:yes stop_codon:yes gene_type:complete
MAIGTRGGIQKTLQESNENYFNDLVDSAVLQGTSDNNSPVSASGGQKLSGMITSNYLDFMTGFVGNLTATSRSLTDAVIDAAGAAGGGGVAAIGNATVSASALNDFLGTADAVGGVFLPSAAVDTHLAIQITGDMDAANAITFHTSGSGAVGEDSDNAVYAKHVIGPLTNSGETAQSVRTAGLPSAPASNRLIYTPAAASTNFLSVGSVIHFYCPVANQWLVRVYNVAEGNGNTGTFTVGS